MEKQREECNETLAVYGSFAYGQIVLRELVEDAYKYGVLKNKYRGIKI